MNAGHSAPIRKPHGRVKFMLRALYVVCVSLLAADFIIHRHVHFSIEAWPGFYAAFGLAAYLAIVLSAKVLRRFIHRSEDYYGESEDVITKDKDADSREGRRE